MANHNLITILACGHDDVNLVADHVSKCYKRPYSVVRMLYKDGRQENILFNSKKGEKTDNEREIERVLTAMPGKTSEIKLFETKGMLNDFKKRKRQH